MIKRISITVVVIAVTAFAACRKDTPVSGSNVTINKAPGGVYISNEGNFQFGNAEVSYYSPSQNAVAEDLFKPANNRSLGDVCQSMYFFNGKAYLVINNSNKIEVVNENSFVSVATIAGLTSPRYFLPVSNTKAYVTDLTANKISVIDLLSNRVTGSITCKGWTEELVLLYGKAYVTNRKSNKVYVINTATDVITDSIAVGFSSSSIRADKNGKLWVLSSGNDAHTINAALCRINPLSNTVEQTFTFTNAADSPNNLDINGSLDTLYFLNKGVCQMSITSASLASNTLIPQGSNNFYGLGIDPANGTVYVADAIDYVQRGTVYRYRPTGQLINTFKAGIIPGDFYFR